MGTLMNVGFGNLVNTEKIISVVSTDAAPIRRMIQTARDEGKAVDATCGRKTKSVLIMESGHMVLSALSTDTIAARINGKKNEMKEEEYE